MTQSMWPRAPRRGIGRARWLHPILCLLLYGFSLSAETFVVTNTLDDASEGSLRWAVQQANAAAGADSIHFALPGTGPHTISPTSSLVIAPPSDPIVIDGYTQTGAMPATGSTPAVLMIEIDGSQAGESGIGFMIWSNACVLRGLTINRFGSMGIMLFANAGGGSGHIVEGNHIGTDVTGSIALGNHDGVFIGGATDNTIGGVSPAARNVISGNNNSGVSITGEAASGNLVIGNYVGTDASGVDTLGNRSCGVYIWGCPGNTIGGASPVYRNIISGNWEAGIKVFGDSLAAGNVVQGNYIGTDKSGDFGLGNGLYGIEILDTYNNTIGGTIAGAGNVIAANFVGVFLSGALGTRLAGNWIGTNATGVDSIGNSWYGVWTNGACNNWVGGLDAGSGNVIAHNDSCGVVIDSLSTGNAVLRNSIFSNGGLGIDLGEDGVTLNDAGDADTGANGLQNFPMLTSATTGAGGTTIEGILNSGANSNYRVEFFFSAAADPDGYGEGQSFMGATTVTTDGTGTSEFSIDLPISVPDQRYITATATDANNNTSEFCAPVFVAAMELTGEVVGDELQLQWSDIVSADSYWVYGAPDYPFFAPGLVSPYQYRRAVILAGTTAWSTTEAVGNPDDNWVYLVIAVDATEEELVRSNRIGECDYEGDIP